MGKWKHRIKSHYPNTNQVECEYCGMVDSVIFNNIPKCKNARYDQRRPTKHGIKSEDYRWLIANSKCVICSSEDKLGVDHDHDCCPGRFGCIKCNRGILCQSCNLSMLALDNPHLDDLLAYKARHQLVKAPLYLAG